MADKPKTPNVNEDDTSHDSEPSEPKYVTAAQLNAAITARFKSFESKLDDYFAKLQPTPAPEAKKDAAPAQSDEALKRIAALEKQLEVSRKEAETAKQRHLDTSLRTRVSEELGKIGISSPKHALALLVDSEKRIAWSDDEQLVWRGDDGSEAPLGEGLKTWAKTADAKLYMAPRGTSGSGDRGAPAANNPSNKLTMQDGAHMLAELFGGRVGQ